MQRDPGLWQQPDQPDPGVLLADENVEEITGGALPVQVVGQAVLEVTAVVIMEAASNHQQWDSNWDGKIDGKSEGKS